jgi:hypothetical protein
VNVVDGKTIQGHDAVKAYLDEEQKLIDEYGQILIFQVYRMNLQANNIDGLQGERLVEIRVDSDFISGDDTVAAAKDKIRNMLREGAVSQAKPGERDTLPLDSVEQMTLCLGGRVMKDDTLFYADNFIMLPVWIQVFIHRCDTSELLVLVAKLREP